MKVTRTSEQPWMDGIKRGQYQQRRKPLGGDQLACGLWELAPGKKSFPLHRHFLTEEALYVVSGRGQVRTPEGLTPIGPGDFVSFPAGGEAHQLINDGDEPLVYVGIAATKGADIVEYPDSNKVAASVGKFPNATRYLLKKDQQPDYFDGEKDAD